MINLNKIGLEKILNSGKFCTVTFIKKDGSTRVINGRMGVKKHLRGGKRTSSESEYIMFYDVVNKGYRNVAKDSIIGINGLGLKIKG